MGIARLLAKGWIIFCLFAAAHAMRFDLAAGVPLANAAFSIGICVLLFMAMGLLFAGGFGASGAAGLPLRVRAKPHHWVPGFNEIVFVGFVILSFISQAVLSGAGWQQFGRIGQALESAIYFVVPGQRALVHALDHCSMDGGRLFSASFAWMLAVIFLASAASRLRLQAGIIRLERAARADMLGPTWRAFLLGIVAVMGLQFLFVGSAYPWLGCSAFADITGALLIGLAPLMLAYVIVAALASLLASSKES